MLKKKKIPLRMCLGCQEMKPKKELIRVVRSADSGEIRIDQTGKLAGRGAYICKNLECFEKAYKAKRLEKALEHSVNADVYEALRGEVKPNE
jgi:Predicted nucleic-acid-binding protein implicated in transcription termination